MLSTPVRIGDIIGPKAAVADGAVMAWDGTSGYVAKSATAIDGLPIGQTTPEDGTFLTLTGKRLVVPEKGAISDPASVIGSEIEHDSSGISQLDIFSDETFSYSHNLRLIHSGTTGQNNAWCHMYGPKGTLTSDQVHMWSCDYVGASQIGQLKLFERGGAQKMVWNWGSDANTYFHFGAGSRIGTAKLSVNGDVSFSGTMTATLAENAVWVGNESNQNTTLATGTKGRALLGLADDAALTTEILARVTGSTIVGTKLEATSTDVDSIKTAGGIEGNTGWRLHRYIQQPNVVVFYLLMFPLVDGEKTVGRFTLSNAPTSSRIQGAQVDISTGRTFGVLRLNYSITHNNPSGADLSVVQVTSGGTNYIALKSERLLDFQQFSEIAFYGFSTTTPTIVTSVTAESAAPATSGYSSQVAEEIRSTGLSLFTGGTTPAAQSAGNAAVGNGTVRAGTSVISPLFTTDTSVSSLANDTWLTIKEPLATGIYILTFQRQTLPSGGSGFFAFAVVSRGSSNNYVDVLSENQADVRFDGDDLQIKQTSGTQRNARWSMVRISEHS
jgi:hypothetical protein